MTLEEYYNKHNEEHRLETRHGQVEFAVSMHYIERCLGILVHPGLLAQTGLLLEDTAGADGADRSAGVVAGAGTEAEISPQPDSIAQNSSLKILDVGAGTGRYSVALSEKGYDVTAVELVKRNIEVLRQKKTPVKTWCRDARDLSFLADNTFDLTLVFGPLYHLHGNAEKLKVLEEARRVTKPGGFILCAYVMNDYSVLTWCFAEERMPALLQAGDVDEHFHIHSAEDELYDYVRLDDATRLMHKASLLRETMFSPDGPADYMRRELNAMSEESFAAFIKYQLANAERHELLGAGSHLVDVLRKPGVWHPTGWEATSQSGGVESAEV